MKNLNLVFVLISLVFASCKKEIATTQNTTTKPLNEQIEDYLKTQKELHEIPGLAVAIIKNNETIYKGYFGVENLETEKQVDSETIFPVYSVTKLATATAIFKLIEENKLQLNDSIGKYIPNLPTEWQRISVQNLLTHSSGLPDFILSKGQLSDEEMLSELKKIPLLFEKGAYFKYNQTNYWFLAEIIKKITNSTYKEYILENQFNGLNTVLITSNFKEKIENRVMNYDYNNQLKAYEKAEPISGKRARAANGLNISLDDFIAWNIRFDENSFIKPETKTQMWQPFIYQNSDVDFLQGWGSYPINTTISYGFTGGLKTGFRKFTKNDLTIIYLSNGFKYRPVHNIIIDHLAGMVDENLLDKNALINEKINNTFFKGDLDAMLNVYKEAKKKNPALNSENTFNSIGYILLRKNEVEKAIRIFKFNTQEYPNSANVFDSLGEAYFNAEKYGLSKENYEKSLVLDPNNENATTMLQKIEKLTTKK